ncbi:MAG: hypothetical protein ACREFZ_08830, partial [Acetobacteraceae bacterium]
MEEKMVKAASFLVSRRAVLGAAALAAAAARRSSAAASSCRVWHGPWLRWIEESDPRARRV